MITPDEIQRLLSAHKYFSYEDLKPIKCGNSGLTLIPVDYSILLNKDYIFMLEKFGNTDRLKEFLPSLDFSSEEKIKKTLFGMCRKAELGTQFTYSITLNGVLLGMIFVDTPVGNRIGMGFEDWTIDFFLFEAFEGNGYMSVALPRMMMYMKNNLNIDVFYVLIDPNNERCINLISQFPFDEIDNSGFSNHGVNYEPPLVYECSLSTIRFQYG